MTIEQEITKLNTNLTNSYTAVSNKGGTLPANENFDNLPNAINSIQTGGASSKYGATIDSFLGDVDTNGVLQPVTAQTDLVFTGVEDIASNCFPYGFYRNSKIKSVSFPDLTGLSGSNAMNYAFYGCTDITSVDLSSLTTVSGSNAMNYAFYGCTDITSVDLSSLTTVSGSNAVQGAFIDCTGITSVNLNNLTTVSGSNAMKGAFGNCYNITSVDLSNLTTVTGSNAMGSAFSKCTDITSVDLSSLTTVSGSNAMNYAFYSCARLANILFTNLETIGENTSTTDYGQFALCFSNCTNLTTLTFPKLKEIYCTGGTTTSYGTFANNNKVEKMYFPKLDTITYGTGASITDQNACKNVFYGCSALTELHFGAANQAAIEASPGYSTAWGRGAGKVTIYFDL